MHEGKTRQQFHTNTYWDFKTLPTFLLDLYSEEQYYKNNDKEQQTSVLTIPQKN